LQFAQLDSSGSSPYGINPDATVMSFMPQIQQVASSLPGQSGLISKYSPNQLIANGGMQQPPPPYQVPASVAGTNPFGYSDGGGGGYAPRPQQIPYGNWGMGIQPPPQRTYQPMPPGYNPGQYASPPVSLVNPNYLSQINAAYPQMQMTPTQQRALALQQRALSGADALLDSVQGEVPIPLTMQKGRAGNIARARASLTRQGQAQMMAERKAYIEAVNSRPQEQRQAIATASQIGHTAYQQEQEINKFNAGLQKDAVDHAIKLAEKFNFKDEVKHIGSMPPPWENTAAHDARLAYILDANQRSGGTADMMQFFNYVDEAAQTMQAKREAGLEMQGYKNQIQAETLGSDIERKIAQSQIAVTKADVAERTKEATIAYAGIKNQLANKRYELLQKFGADEKAIEMALKQSSLQLNLNKAAEVADKVTGSTIKNYNEYIGLLLKNANTLDPKERKTIGVRLQALESALGPMGADGRTPQAVLEAMAFRQERSNDAAAKKVAMAQASALPAVGNLEPQKIIQAAKQRGWTQKGVTDLLNHAEKSGWNTDATLRAVATGKR
jgi:hypothetical protein